LSKLDFALKDFYRKKEQTYPYVLVITLVIAITIFFIYFTTSLGLNLLLIGVDSQLFFSGSINIVYSNFNTLILILMICLAVVLVVIITTTMVITKKRDIAIMKALGTLPGSLYGFYLVEAYIIFIFGFILGLIFGFMGFGVFAIVMLILKFPLQFQFDWFYTSILFGACLLGIFAVSGFVLRKIGNQKIIKTFSRDIPYDYDASKKLTFIPKWLTALGFNLKMAVVNTIRRKGEYRRYIIIFTLIFLIIITLGLGTLVLGNSAQEWIRKAQGENFVVIGHEDTVKYYSQMYEMFSNPSINIGKDDIDFIDPNYLFNLSDIADIQNIEEIEKTDDRLIKFCDVEELNGHHFYYNYENESYGYDVVGQQRTGVFPIMGVNSSNVLQKFEVEGRFITEAESSVNMTIGDGLAYNFFDYAFDQSLELVNYNKIFKVTGVVIDSFYSGYAGYVGLDTFRSELNSSSPLNLTTEINLVILQLKANTYNDIKDELEMIIKTNLSQSFTHLLLDGIFEANMNYLLMITLYPLFIIIILSIVIILSLYNYQKAGLMEKAKDFLIMRAIGSKNRTLKRILYIESFFILVPSLLLSLALGMIINSTLLLDRAYLPSLFLPFILFAILFVALLIINYLSLIPLMRKINKFSIKDFAMY
jgi:ABC-type antimicrobial peptide transport system permease subunit